MFRYMPRKGYKSGFARLDIYLSPVNAARLRSIARDEGKTISEMVASLLRDRVEQAPVHTLTVVDDPWEGVG